MQHATGRLTVIAFLLFVVAAAGLALALDRARAEDKRAAALQQNDASAAASAEYLAALTKLSLPAEVARDTAKVDNCTTIGMSRCWITERTPGESVELMRSSIPNVDLVSITERPGIPGAGGDYVIVVKAENGQRIALSVMARKLRDQSDGQGPTQWQGSVIQALPTSE